MTIDLSLADYVLYKNGDTVENITSPFDDEINGVITQLNDINLYMVQNMGTKVFDTEELEHVLCDLRKYRQDYFELTYDLYNIVEYSINGIIYKIENNKRHNLYGPAVIFTESYAYYKQLSKSDKFLYYINGNKMSEDEWEKHPERKKTIRKNKLFRILR